MLADPRFASADLYVLQHRLSPPLSFSCRAFFFGRGRTHLRIAPSGTSAAAASSAAASSQPGHLRGLLLGLLLRRSAVLVGGGCRRPPEGRRGRRRGLRLEHRGPGKRCSQQLSVHAPLQVGVCQVQLLKMGVETKGPAGSARWRLGMALWCCATTSTAGCVRRRLAAAPSCIVIIWLGPLRQLTLRKEYRCLESSVSGKLKAQMKAIAPFDEACCHGEAV